MLRSASFVLCCVALVFAQDDLDSLVKEVFGNNNQNPGTNLQPQGQGGNNCPAGQTCVPYYLCNNGSIITDGVGIIDIR